MSGEYNNLLGNMTSSPYLTGSTTSADQMVVEAHGLFFSMQSIVIMCLIVATIVGNSFIIFVILWNKKLRIVQNYLTLSLSVTDLLVAVVVMIPSFIHNSTNLLQEGYLCKLWISLDIVCCSSSILHQFW